MDSDVLSPTKRAAYEAFSAEFGSPDRETKKVAAWEAGAEVSFVLQKDQPAKADVAIVWLSHPGDGAVVPEDALEYAAESGRHSNTYPSPGLERGKPALKMAVSDPAQIASLVEYARAMSLAAPLPKMPSAKLSSKTSADGPGASEPHEPSMIRVDVASMPRAPEPKPRREAIPRAVQREVWQRDGGRCVECNSRELLCFDHIVPFSRGGSNTIRNLQLLCEKCNLSKSNRI